MNKETYSKEAMKFAAYDDNMYPFWAVLEELGEFAGKIAKSLRGDKELDIDGLCKEAGDVLWQLNAAFQESENGAMPKDNDTYAWFLGIFEDVCLGFGYDHVSDVFEEYIEATLNMDPNEIRQENIDKLTDRKNRNVISGNGDNR